MKYKLTRGLLSLLCWLGAVACAHGGYGLSVDGQGGLRLAGKAFRGVGVNYFDAFVRTLGQPVPTNYDGGFRELAARHIPFARFAAGGYWPVDWGLYQTNRTEYFARFDGVVQSAARHGVGLIPSLFWNPATVPDLMGEPCNRWGDTGSRTIAFMRQYTRELVTRYASSPTIWGWEFGSEYNLAMDLPNAAEHLPAVEPLLGTPARRTVADEFTQAAVTVALREFARTVQADDAGRIIISGDAFPRPSAWHLMTEKSWRTDTRAQFTLAFVAENPAPLNTFCVHAYDLTNDFGRLADAMAVARAAGRPLLVGEFGVPAASRRPAREQFAAMLAAIETNHVPLAALWVFDFASQAKDWNVTATNERSWQLEAIEEANEWMQRDR